MGDYSNICELRGRAAEGKGCANGATYPNSLKYCAKRNQSLQSTNNDDCTTLDVDTLIDPNIHQPNVVTYLGRIVRYMGQPVSYGVL